MLLSGSLTVPTGASGIVVFAHGRGSSHNSPRKSVSADTRFMVISIVGLSFVDGHEDRHV